MFSASENILGHGTEPSGASDTTGTPFASDYFHTHELPLSLGSETNYLALSLSHVLGP